MRRLMASALVAVMASDGCALQARRGQAGAQMPTGAAAVQIHDWSALGRLPPGAHVLVEVDSAGLVADASVRATINRDDKTRLRNVWPGHTVSEQQR